MKTHYDTLGVKKDAEQDEIRKVYLDLAKKLHPDKTGGDKEAENKLKEINAAYDILKDKKKRAEYDASLRPASMLNHILKNKFGQTMYDEFMRQHDRFAPQNRKAIVSITLEEAYRGCEKKVTYKKFSKCEKCDGVGGDKVEKCSTCNGSGVTHINAGFQQITRTCHTCKGSGGKVLDKCTECDGTGIISDQIETFVRVPEGADTGMYIQIPGEGAFGGDLIVFVEVLPHDSFERQGPHITSELEVPLTKAILGGKMKTKSLKGEVEVNIPEGSDTGATLRLKGLGMPIGENYGDHHLFLRVKMPKSLSKKAKDLVEKLDKELSSMV